MSDDTTRPDNWSSAETSGSTSQSSAENPADRVGFCQDCGKPLTTATVRAVGTGVFCEPCLATRVMATPTASGYAAVPPYTTVLPQAAVGAEPSPTLATILGFIPGVGAMYNGQFAKGIVHLVIFAVLVLLANNANGIFWLFVFGWIFYMMFEAHHTAVARRDDLPLPNAFGFNDIGERMGFGKTWGVVNARPAGTVPPPVPGATPAADPFSSTPYAAGNTVPVGTAPDWVGYVPPTAFGAPPPVIPVTPIAASQPTAAWSHAPYTGTFTGAPSAYDPAVPLATVFTPDLPARHRFPTGAFWLIGLGILILLANLLPDWKITERWWPPVLFAGLSVWTFTRRMRAGARLVCIIRWPVILMVLAILLALHAAYFTMTFGLTCSILLIVFGALLLLERTAGASPVYVSPLAAAPYSAPANAPVSAADLQAEEARSRAAWVAPGNDTANSNPNNSDDSKGGQ